MSRLSPGVQISFTVPDGKSRRFKYPFINELPYTTNMFISELFLKTKLSVENFLIVYAWFMRGQNSILVVSSDD